MYVCVFAGHLCLVYKEGKHDTDVSDQQKNTGGVGGGGRRVVSLMCHK